MRLAGEPDRAVQGDVSDAMLRGLRVIVAPYAERSHPTPRG